MDDRPAPLPLDEPVLRHVRPDPTALHPDRTVAEVLEEFRRRKLGETIVYLYVVDERDVLRGVVPVRRLLAAPPDRRIGDLMVGPPISVPSGATIGEACYALLDRRFLALPVTDPQGRLVGSVDVALFNPEIKDIAERTDYQDLFQLAGLHVARTGTVLSSFRDRFPWLLATVAGGLGAAVLLSLGEEVLRRGIVFALFIPVVLALAESLGIQTVTLTLQRLHGAVKGGGRLSRLALRELGVAVLLALGCAAIVGVIVALWRGDPYAAAAIALSIVASMSAACLLGLLLPTLVLRTGRNPGVASGPLVLAAVDTVTLLVYLGTATWLTA